MNEYFPTVVQVIPLDNFHVQPPLSKVLSTECPLCPYLILLPLGILPFPLVVYNDYIIRI